ncbi:MAG TPA: response regulator [Candidatus Thermoplasmatota archaeon]|nr:response regulator [Candidatus Thermoplasmatota archaeon]
MKQILVVDDADTMRAMLRAALETHEWHVTEAATADAGLDLARKTRFDVIILDFVLPDADGLVLLRELRHWGVSAPVVALTGASSTEVAYRFIRAGASDFLVKEGLTSGDIRAAVRHALRLGEAGVHVRSRVRHTDEEEEEEGAQTLLDDPPDGAPEDSAALRILVVDDTSIARAAVRAVLGRVGWTIDEAEDLKSALAAIRDRPPDIVLLDYLLPDMDGIEAMRALRDGGLQAPVIALSGHGSEELAERFLRAGASDFLGKDDLSEERFVHAIRRAVASHAAFSRAQR